MGKKRGLLFKCHKMSWRSTAVSPKEVIELEISVRKVSSTKHICLQCSGMLFRDFSTAGISEKLVRVTNMKASFVVSCGSLSGQWHILCKVYC